MAFARAQRVLHSLCRRGGRNGLTGRTLAIGPTRSGRRSQAAIPFSRRRLQNPSSIIPASAARSPSRSAQRLGWNDDDRARFTRVATEAFAAAPELVDAARLDLEGIVRHDPAVTALLPPLLNFKGFVALQAWRVSNWLWQRGRSDFARLMQSASSERLQVSIHPSASIGTSVFLDHATGIIIGALSEIGDDVTMMQNVTIGRGPDNPVRAPRIGRGVYLSSGSKHHWRHQHRRFRKGRRRRRGHPRCARRLHRRRRPGAADQLSGRRDPGVSHRSGANGLGARVYLRFCSTHARCSGVKL